MPYDECGREPPKVFISILRRHEKQKASGSLRREKQVAERQRKSFADGNFFRKIVLVGIASLRQEAEAGKLLRTGKEYNSLRLYHDRNAGCGCRLI